MKKTIGMVMIVLGLLLGAGLFTLGANQDAPGMCVLGLSGALIFVLKGSARLKWFPATWVNRCLFTAFGAGGILLTAVLLGDGEFASHPEWSLLGFILGGSLLYWGNRRQLRKSPPSC